MQQQWLHFGVIKVFNTRFRFSTSSDWHCNAPLFIVEKQVAHRRRCRQDETEPKAAQPHSAVHNQCRTLCERLLIRGIMVEESGGLKNMRQHWHTLQLTTPTAHMHTTRPPLLLLEVVMAAAVQVFISDASMSQMCHECEIH